MEQIKIDPENEDSVLDEEQLDNVAGGQSQDNSNCWFLPETPVQYKIEGDIVRVKCRSTCGVIGICGCYKKSDRCIDKWHKATKFGSEWWPYNFSYNNHNSEDKKIMNLVVPGF